MTLEVNQKDEPVTVSQPRSQGACRRYGTGYDGLVETVRGV